jgi:hypothetical protein
VFRIRIRIGSGFNQVSGPVSIAGYGIRIRIQEGKNDPQKKEKNLEISCFEALDVLFGAECFFCSLDVLNGGLEKDKL